MNFPGFAALTAGTGIPGINPLGFFVPNYNITVTPTQNPMASHYKNIHSMKTQMPTDILEMFKANEIVFIKPPKKRKCRTYDPLLLYNKDRIEQLKNILEQQKQPFESKNKQNERRRKEKELNHRLGLIQKMDQWNPFENQLHTQDPFKTLFVSKLDYKTTEQTLYNQFRMFGPIKKVRIIKDLKGRSRGYGFIQFQQTQHFVNAYKKTNHRMLDNRRIIVDKERGRTEVKFRPMRLGQGMGGQSRRQKSELQQDIMLQKTQKQQIQQARAIKKKIKEAEVDNFIIRKRKEKIIPKNIKIMEEKKCTRNSTEISINVQRNQKKIKKKQKEISLDIKTNTKKPTIFSKVKTDVKKSTNKKGLVSEEMDNVSKKKKKGRKKEILNKEKRRKKRKDRDKKENTERREFLFRSLYNEIIQ